MNGIEDLLREELQRVTDAVQREHLRPLRAPARRQRWQWRLIPLAAAAAVIAIITVAALMTGPPSWADGDRMLAFTWQVSKNLTTSNTVMQGVRLLDTSAPGGNLMDSRQIVSSRAVQGTIQSALITPDGRNVIVAASREVPSGGGRGTVVGQISEVKTASGKLARVLRTQTARYTNLTHFVLDGSTEVFSLDPAGRYALVQNMQFGWMDIGGPDPGRFTPLPGFPAGHEVFWAAW